MLWFFLGGLGAHRFYLGRTGSAIAQLALGLLAFPTAFITLLPLGLWLLADLFLIPGIVRDYNMSIADKFAFD